MIGRGVTGGAKKWFKMVVEGGGKEAVGKFLEERRGLTARLRD
jgi:hypothetical protein